jgi:hypothetical protein
MGGTVSDDAHSAEPVLGHSLQAHEGSVFMGMTCEQNRPDLSRHNIGSSAKQ